VSLNLSGVGVTGP